MSANELRKAADTLRSQASEKEPGKAIFTEALAAWLARSADVLTTIDVLDGAGVEMLILDAGAEALDVAHLINGGES